MSITGCDQKYKKKCLVHYNIYISGKETRYMRDLVYIRSHYNFTV